MTYETHEARVAYSISEQIPRIYDDAVKNPADEAIDEDLHEIDAESAALLKSAPVGAKFYVVTDGGPGGTFTSLHESVESAITSFDAVFDFWEDDSGKVRPQFERAITAAIDSFRADPSTQACVNSDSPDEQPSDWFGMESTTVSLYTLTKSVEPPTVDETDPEVIAAHAHIGIMYASPATVSLTRRAAVRDGDSWDYSFDTATVATLEASTLKIHDEARVLESFPSLDMFRERVLKIATR